jgi:glycine cleavage system pyridoxal-binding protein P
VDIESLHSAVYEISGVYPVESIQLRELIVQLSKAKSASFTASSTNEEVYLQLLSAHEVDLDLAETELENSIKQLARKHSAVT